MAMVVQHNITAMNANRQLGVTTGSQAKSSEKLSSGYRINRAGDDAAGLKISEKMRSQVRGLNRASTNAQDGVSLIQTAEGALNEAHSILQRMNELAVQGANDTNEGIDRDAINQELDQLTQELDRISTTTQFNKQNLLDGTFQSKNLQVGANANQKIEITIDNMNAETLGLRSIQGEELGKVQTGVKPTTVTYKGTTYTYDVTKSQAANISFAKAEFAAAISRAANDDHYVMQTDKVTGSVYYIGGESRATSQVRVMSNQIRKGFSIDSKSHGISTGTQYSVLVSRMSTVVKKVISHKLAVTSGLATKKLWSTDSAGHSTYALSGTAIKTSQVQSTFLQAVAVSRNATGGDFTRYATISAAKAADIAFAKSTMAKEMNNNFGKYLKTENLTADDASVGANAAASTFTMTKPSVDSYAKANATITAVQDAINRVSTQRSALGALQNRLEHTIANLDNVAENTQSAESRIRDTDMASEMVEYSKNNILAQAGQSMLAQANQSNQGVLSLLQ